MNPWVTPLSRDPWSQRPKCLPRHCCTSLQCGCRGPIFLLPRMRRRCRNQDYCYRCLGVVAAAVECTVVVVAVDAPVVVASDASAAFAAVDAAAVAVVAFVAEELVLVEIVADAGGD